MARLVSTAPLAAALALLSGAAAQAAPASQPPSGKDLYAARGCSACHGTHGLGSISGPRLAGTPLPFEAFATQVRNPRAQMPPYSRQVLSDAELRLIYDFIKTQTP